MFIFYFIFLFIVWHLPPLAEYPHFWKGIAGTLFVLSPTGQGFILWGWLGVASVKERPRTD